MCCDERTASQCGANADRAQEHLHERLLICGSHERVADELGTSLRVVDSTTPRARCVICVVSFRSMLKESLCSRVVRLEAENVGIRS